MGGQRLDLIDLVTDVLAHWRGVLVALLLGGVLFGTIDYLQSYRNAELV